MKRKTKLTTTVPVLLFLLVLLTTYAAGCRPAPRATAGPIATLGPSTVTPAITATPTASETAITTPSPTSSPTAPAVKATTTAAATAKNGTLYKNTKYGFQLDLPQDWKGYTIVKDQWKGVESATNKVVQTGPEILIRNPKWTKKKPYQDIPILVFTRKQWNALQKDSFHIGAAPVGPSELSRNNTYVFALPARYNYAFPAGYEEVDKYLQTKPLKPFNPSK